MHHQQMRRLPHHRDRREIARWIVRYFAVKTFIDGLCTVRADKERMTISLCSSCFGRCKIAARTNLALHHNGVTESRLEVLRQQTSRKVSAAAGWERHNDTNGFARPTLGTRWRRNRRAS